MKRLDQSPPRRKPSLSLHTNSQEPSNIEDRQKAKGGDEMKKLIRIWRVKSLSLKHSKTPVSSIPRQRSMDISKARLRMKAQKYAFVESIPKG